MGLGQRGAGSGEREAPPTPSQQEGIWKGLWACRPSRDVEVCACFPWHRRGGSHEWSVPSSHLSLLESQDRPSARPTAGAGAKVGSWSLQERWAPHPPGLGPEVACDPPAFPAPPAAPEAGLFSKEKGCPESLPRESAFPTSLLLSSFPLSTLLGPQPGLQRLAVRVSVEKPNQCNTEECL